jgi:hypothetical protein
MGLSFHYAGRIADYNNIDKLVEEAKLLSTDLHWNYKVFDSPELKGIAVIPADAEPLWLCFTPDGKTCNPGNLKFRKPTDEFYSTIHVKTQYAGAEVHKSLLHLLDYINKKYFAELEVMDEGNYWGTWDDTELSRRLVKYERILEIMAAELKDERSKEETKS